MASARYWRLSALAAYDAGASLQLSALHLYAGNARACAAAVLSVTLAPVSGSVAALQDDSTATVCEFSQSQLQAPGLAIVWDLGSSPADVSAIRLGAGDARLQFLGSAVLQSSSDGLNWSNAVSIGSAAYPGVRTFTGPIELLSGASAIWTESFLSGVPANFADTYSDSGSLATTWEAATEAVLMEATGYNVAWKPRSFAPSVNAGLEADFEYLADFGNVSLVGVSFFGGDKVWHVLVYFPDPAFLVFVSDGPERISLTTRMTSVPITLPVGSRHTLRVTSAPGPNGQVFTLWLNGLEIGAYTAAGLNSALTCALYVRSTRLRLHSISAIGLSASAASALPPTRTQVSCFSIAASAPVVAARVAGALRAETARDTEFGGQGRLWGTTKTEISPGVFTPTKARVSVLRQRDKLLAREVWSDPATGAWEVRGLDTAQAFIEVAQHVTGEKQAVAADQTVPVEVTP